MSLNHNYTYWSDGGRKILIGHTTDSGGGGVTESLASEIKMLVALFSSIVSSTAACMTNLGHCIKVCNKSMMQVVLRRSLSCNYCTRFGRHRRHLMNTSKIHGL